MEINILSLGKFKVNQHLRDVFEYYKERIRVNIKLVELKTFKSQKKAKLEKQEILKYIAKDDYVIALDKGGENISSLTFSKMLKLKLDDGCKRINFVIGSEEGLDVYFKETFKVIAFGRQTWPHLLMRVMLIEQIYRAFEIIKNSKYHK